MCHVRLSIIFNVCFVFYAFFQLFHCAFIIRGHSQFVSHNNISPLNSRPNFCQVFLVDEKLPFLWWNVILSHVLMRCRFLEQFLCKAVLCSVTCLYKINRYIVTKCIDLMFLIVYTPCMTSILFNIYTCRDSVSYFNLFHSYHTVPLLLAEILLANF